MFREISHVSYSWDNNRAESLECVYDWRWYSFVRRMFSYRRNFFEYINNNVSFRDLSSLVRIDRSQTRYSFVNCSNWVKCWSNIWLLQDFSNVNTDSPDCCLTSRETFNCIYFWWCSQIVVDNVFSKAYRTQKIFLLKIWFVSFLNFLIISNSFSKVQ